MIKYIDVGKELVRLHSLGLSCENVVRKFLMTAPTAEVQEVRHGRWEFIGGYGYQYRCSVCCTCAERKFKFCPYCGAKMDKVGE